MSLPLVCWGGGGGREVDREGRHNSLMEICFSQEMAVETGSYCLVIRHNSPSLKALIKIISKRAIF